MENLSTCVTPTSAGSNTGKFFLVVLLYLEKGAEK